MQISRRVSLEFVSLNNAASSMLFVLSPWKTFICIGGRQDGEGREERKRKRKGGRASKVQRHAGVWGGGGLPQQVRPKSRAL